MQGLPPKCAGASGCPPCRWAAGDVPNLIEAASASETSLVAHDLVPGSGGTGEAAKGVAGSPRTLTSTSALTLVGVDVRTSCEGPPTSFAFRTKLPIIIIFVSAGAVKGNQKKIAERTVLTRRGLKPRKSSREWGRMDAENAR